MGDWHVSEYLAVLALILGAATALLAVRRAEVMRLMDLTIGEFADLHIAATEFWLGDSGLLTPDVIQVAETDFNMRLDRLETLLQECRKMLHLKNARDLMPYRLMSDYLTLDIEQRVSEPLPARLARLKELHRLRQKAIVAMQARYFSARERLRIW